jgi:DNA-binding LytR/AlgR family response regulator
MITCIAVDDEPRALDVIEIHAAKMQELKVLGLFTDPYMARDFLKNNPVDLILLDINMPGLNGMQLLDQLSFRPLVIFATAYSEYALDSYDYEAVDYLLKPIEFDRFAKAIMKVKKVMDSRKEKNGIQNKFMFLKDGYKQVKVIIDDIQYIQSDGNYLNVFTTSGKVNTRMTLNQIIELLPSNSFIRIHNSFVINIGHLQKIENNQAFLPDVQITIGPMYREAFFEFLNRR